MHAVSRFGISVGMYSCWKDCDVNIGMSWLIHPPRQFKIVNNFSFVSRQQQGDETPMVWEMLLYIYILYSPDWHYRSTMPTFLFLYGAAFAVFHSLVRFEIGFKVHYVILCLLCIPRMYKYYIHTKDAHAKWLAKLYLGTIFVGSLCWLFDRLFCKNISSWFINPQGHALWHVLMGFNSYFANTFLMFCRAQQRGWNPKVDHCLGLLPYVKIEKPKTQWVNLLRWKTTSLSLSLAISSFTTQIFWSRCILCFVLLDECKW